MDCSSCGKPMPADAAFCPSCGTSVRGGAPSSAATPTPPGPAPAEPGGNETILAGDPPPVTPTAAANPGATSPPPTSPPPTSPPATGAGGTSAPIKLDTSNLTRTDWITGIASLVVLIALFLPWYTVTIAGIGASANGVQGHGWLWLVFFISLAIVGYEVAKLAWSELRSKMPVPESTALLAATGVNLVLVVIAFLFKAGTGEAILVHVSIGWGIGAFLGLVAAVVAAFPLVRPFINSKTSPPTSS